MADEQLSARGFLAGNDVEFFLNDAVSLLLKARPDRPLEFLYLYFQSVKNSTHVVSRDFNFVNANYHNRSAFLAACDRAFCNFEDKEKISIGDLHQMATLLCPSFPENRTFEVPRLLKKDSSETIPFGELKTAFYVHFIFYELFLELKELFTKKPSEPSGSDGQRLIWVQCTFSEVKKYIKRSNDISIQNREKMLATHAMSAAYGDTGESLSFDELVLRLLRNQELAKEVVADPTIEWEPRALNEVVANLFAKRNSRGEFGPEDEELTKLAAKPKMKEKTKAVKKTKST